jgi:Golgi apparatus protein 1
VSASGVFELRMDRFQNELGRDAKGHCCRGFKTSSSSGSVGAANGRCSETCRTQFRVCLKQYQTSIDLSGPCIFGDYMTPVIGDNNSLELSSSSNNTNVTGYTVRLPFDFSWPVSFHQHYFFLYSHQIAVSN